MCGLTGFLSSSFSLEEATSIVSGMADCLIHRGPDDTGIWFDGNSGIALAHRRLSILDLSPTGHQPMCSTSSRYTIAFNGEIYNHQRIRAELEKQGAAPTWRGHSDTETLLAGIERWGLEAMLQQCIGMFAIALWDKQTQVLKLALDRIGEKPLYYGWQGSSFLFASELKALQAHPHFQADINRNALCLYMRHNYIPAPHSIYLGIHKLMPGSILQLSRQHPEPQVKHYWSVQQAVTQGKISPFKGSATDAITTLESLLRDSIKQQMIADVPLGAFLSGGIDSSTVVALMQAQSGRPVKTFSIGFHEAAYNEAEHAKAVARHLGTEHTELYVTPDDCMAVIPNLPNIYNEPFSDSSQVPTFLVSQLARQHVTVSLSGDAGDELFAGYNRYTWTHELWSRLSRIPSPLRNLAATAVTAASPAAWNAASHKMQFLLPERLKQTNIGDKLHKAASVMASPSINTLYHKLVSHWEDPAVIVLNGKEPLTPITDSSHIPSGIDDIERMMYLDMLTYLPGDILCKVDRAAMAVSLESRVPFLDHRVVEFAWSLPMHYKLRENQGKWLLREVLYKYVPKELLERPKMGFGIPVDQWLRGPLRDWAEHLLDESRLHQDGYFDPAPIRQKWAEHLSGKRNWQYHLWDVLMLQSWLETQ